AEAHAHAGDRGIARQRKAVDGFEDLVAILTPEAIDLGQAQRRQRTGDFAVEVGSPQRHKAARLVLPWLSPIDDFQHTDAFRTRILKDRWVKHGADSFGKGTMTGTACILDTHMGINGPRVFVSRSRALRGWDCAQRSNR